MRVAVLGPLEVDANANALGPRDRVVLTALVLHHGEAVSGDRLADALWGDEVPASWNKVVQGCVVRLRKELGSNAIETLPAGYRLAIAPENLDVHRFERSLGRVRELLVLGEPERAMYVAEEALQLWRGQPLVDAENWEPAQIEAHRLNELRMEAEELRLDAALRAGRHREVLGAARAAVEAAPTREHRWELLALAQYRSGRQGDALRTLNEARAVLAGQLGVDPGPGLQALEQAVLRQDPDLAAPESLPAPSATCPWPGLPAYGVGDAEQFFGRDEVVAACLERLAAEGVLVVVGPSGNGKSSLVRAGVAAALQRAGRRVAVITPGARRPVDALSAFAADGADVLVVDQFEEAMSPEVAVSDRQAFFDALDRHAARAPLVIALRADRLGEVSADEHIARLVERGLFLLAPMSEADLRMAIEGPARQAALLLEPGLVDLVVRDVLDEPGALPLMSHALRQTWANRHGRTMTVDAYRQTGGIRGAVAQTAEGLYEDLDAAGRSKLRELMLRLVSLDGAGPTRARVPRSLLADDPTYSQLIEQLVAARLLTGDGEAVEIAHEALARAWPRLRDWLDEDVEGLRLLRHLSAAATGWDALGRPDSELYRGVRLAQAIEWEERSRPTLATVERAFLDASVAHHEADLRSAEAQIVRERRTVRRLRRLVVGAALLATAAVVASVAAFDQRNRADDQARVAEARRLSAQALVARPQDRALLLAVEAVRLWDSPDTRGSLLTTISRSPRLAGVVRTSGTNLLDFDIDPAGERAALTDAFGSLSLYDLGTRREARTISTSGVLHQAPAFSADGTLLAVGKMSSSCWFGECTVLEIDVFETGDPDGSATTYTGFDAPAADVAFSPDGELLAAAGPLALVDPDGNVAVWRVGQPDRPERLLSVIETGPDVRATPGALPLTWVAFTPDGERLYVSGAGPISEFDLASGELVRSVDGLGGLALSGDGSTIAMRGENNSVELVDAASGAARRTLGGHDTLVTAAAFSDDGTRLATTSTDETVIVWDVETGERVHTLEGHSGSVLNVAFSPDGARLYSSAADRSLFLWDIAGASGVARPLTGATLDEASEGAVLPGPTGESFTVSGLQVFVVELGSKTVTQLQTGFDEVAWAAYSPDGGRLATVGWDGATKLFPVGDRSGIASASRPGRGTDNYGAIAFTADGNGVLVADADGTVVELDGETLEPTGRAIDVGIEANGIRAGLGGRFAVTTSPPDPAGGSDIVFGDLEDERVVRTVHIESWGPRANFSADGTRYAAGGEDGRLYVIDVTGEQAGPHDPVHSGPIAWVTFSPDGKTVASMGFDGTLILSDADTAVPYAHVQPGPANTRGSVVYHPDGHTVLVGYQNGLVIAYETESEAWIAEACRIAGRSLNEDEWRDAFGDQPRRATCPDNV